MEILSPCCEVESWDSECPECEGEGELGDDECPSCAGDMIVHGEFQCAKCLDVFDENDGITITKD